MMNNLVSFAAFFAEFYCLFQIGESNRKVHSTFVTSWKNTRFPALITKIFFSGTIQVYCHATFQLLCCELRETALVLYCKTPAKNTYHR